jgi:hypothetical protein
MINQRVQELLQKREALAKEVIEIDKLIQACKNSGLQVSYQPYITTIVDNLNLVSTAYSATGVEDYTLALKMVIAGLRDACDTALTAMSLPLDVEPAAVSVEPAEHRIKPDIALETIQATSRLDAIVAAAQEIQPRIATKLAEGIEKIVIDDVNHTVCLGNIAFNGSERSWLAKSVRDNFGEIYCLK